MPLKGKKLIADPQSIFIIGGVIWINNSMNLQKKKKKKIQFTFTTKSDGFDPKT